ncbi:MAG TPA: ribosomal protein S18-alanine N-acetyltransferase [Firmicutes bacterium]|nr:ribosomal protein S18-alanine N-acetyltransferase [Bacillota bacterium]
MQRLSGRQKSVDKERADAPQVKIRAMRAEDLNDVVEIERLSFPTPWSRYAFLSELYQNSRSCYLVAELDGRVVGYVGTWLILDEAHITNLAVHPDFRKRGIAHSLMLLLFDICRSKQIRRMTLEVRATNFPAQRLYEKLGFVKVGVRRGYYHDNNEDAIIMWKEDLGQNTGTHVIKLL